MRMLRSWTAAALLSLAAGGRAQDETKPIETMETVEDAEGRISIDLPPGSRLLAQDPNDSSSIARWEVELDGDTARPELAVIVGERSRFRRAWLCGSMDGAWADELVPNSVHTSEGAWSEMRKVPAIESRTVVRIVECQDDVFAVCVLLKEADWERWHAHAQQIAATLRGRVGFRMPPLPEGYQRLPIEGREVWTDAKRDAVDRLLRESATTAATFEKLLPTPPGGRGPMCRMILCSKTEDYASLWKVPGVDAPSPIFVHQPARAVCVDLGKLAADPAGLGNFHHAAAAVLVSDYFGGPLPPWIAHGILKNVVAGVLNDGKFELARPGFVSRGKAAAMKSDAKLADRLAVLVEPAADLEDFACESYAWHYYFRFGPGQKPYGDRYRKCLEGLRKTGDVRDLPKAWNGVDQGKLHREFLDWVSKWKEGKR